MDTRHPRSVREPLPLLVSDRVHPLSAVRRDALLASMDQRGSHNGERSASARCTRRAKIRIARRLHPPVRCWKDTTVDGCAHLG
jgi:hypothetical protein